MNDVVKHSWNYFRAGGVLQVDIKTRDDLRNLRGLDQKLWMALAMPVKGLHGDPRTLALLDTDVDGRIRPPEILAAVEFFDAAVVDSAILFTPGNSLKLDEIRDSNLVKACRRALIQSGSELSTQITVETVENAIAKLKAEVHNGDSVIIPEAADEKELQDLIREIIQSYGSITDRSGLPGIDKQLIDGFYSDLVQLDAWHNEILPQAEMLSKLPNLVQAQETWTQIQEKADDFFARCRWLAFDPNSEKSLNIELSKLDKETFQDLNNNTEMLVNLPLAKSGPNASLPVLKDINPFWQERVNSFNKSVVVPLFGSAESGITEDQWLTVKALMQPVSDWLARKPNGKLAAYSKEKIDLYLRKNLKPDLDNILAKDAQLAVEYNGLNECLRLLLYRRDLGRILRNFINFSDFYRREAAIFQKGYLYLDSRSTALCIDVTRADRHASMASMSGAYLVYCDCQRAGQPAQSIVCLITNGDSDNLMVGRNGVFYDREGLDWDATITKIVSNPISLREAFFSPYKKMARFVEEQVAKRAAAADAENSAGLSKSAEAVAHLDKKEKAAEVAPKKIDVGTVAAIGVAFGSISTFFGLLFTKFMDLGFLMPVGLLAFVLMISGPSMLLAWLKLKNRNLSPILDANGWAVNTSARLNVPFAASMTALRPVPMSATMMPDPFAERKKPWMRYFLITLFGALVVAWGAGKLDRFLPEKFTRTKIFSHN